MVRRLASVLLAFLLCMSLDVSVSLAKGSKGTSSKVSTSTKNSSKSASKTVKNSKTSGSIKKSTVAKRASSGKIARSAAAKNQFMKQTGYPKGRKGYVVDHIVPLECGGADAPSNMQWQTAQAAKLKDKTERTCRK